MMCRPCPHWKNVGVSVYITRKYYNPRREKTMKKAYEVRLADMSTTLVYARTEKSAMKLAESLTYMTAVNARKLDGNGGK